MIFSFNIVSSFTGVSHLLGFLAMGILSYRLFQYWQKEKNVFSKLFFSFFFIFTIFILVTAIGGLFFADNVHILRWVIILTAFIQSLGFAIISYLIVYLKFPRISPWIGAIFVFILGMISTIWTFSSPFSPYLAESGGINWDIGNILGLNLFRLFLFLITFLPLIIILIQQARISNDQEIKRKAIYFGIFVIFGMVVGLFDFLLEPSLNLPAVSSDIAMSILSLFIFVFIFTTRKKVSKDLSKNYGKT